MAIESRPSQINGPLTTPSPQPSPRRTGRGRKPAFLHLESLNSMVMTPPFPRPDPQHPQHVGKYDTELRSDPQQSRNKRATEGATSSPKSEVIWEQRSVAARPALPLKRVLKLMLPLLL